jgi:hypothetical protein
MSNSSCSRLSRQRLAAGQSELDLGLGAPPETGGPLPITASRMGHLWDALGSVYDALGFADAAEGDEVFRQLVLARIIEPTSKLDSLRVLTEAGIVPVSYRTLKRRLPAYAADAWRERLAALCAHHVSLGPATLLLYDVTTLYFETDAGDGFRESGFSKERRLEPQITVGLLTDAAGFCADGQRVRGQQGRDHHDAAGDQGVHGRAPPQRRGHRRRRRDDLREQHEGDRGRRPVVHPRDEDRRGPPVVAEWRKAHPDTEIADGQVFVQPWPAGPTDKRKDQVRYYPYKHDRARRTLKGIDEQVRKAEQAVAGKTAVKRNRFVTLTNATKTVNRELEAKSRALAGIKGYVTNIADPTPEQVIGAYQRLFQIEKSVRMAKSDLAARPIYHRTKDSIEAHLTIVFAALAVSHWIEDTTGWSVKKFVKTVRRYRTIQIQAGEHVITAADPLPDDIHQILEAIKTRAATH